jgi:hypothetical protein
MMYAIYRFKSRHWHSIKVHHQDIHMDAGILVAVHLALGVGRNADDSLDNIRYGSSSRTPNFGRWASNERMLINIIAIIYTFKLTATQIWNSLDAIQGRAIFDDEMRSAGLLLLLL